MHGKMLEDGRYLHLLQFLQRKLSGLCGLNFREMETTEHGKLAPYEPETNEIYVHLLNVCFVCFNVF